MAKEATLIVFTPKRVTLEQLERLRAEQAEVANRRVDRVGSSYSLYSGPHCLDQKQAILRYTWWGRRDRDTFADCLAGLLGLVCRPCLRYIHQAG